MLKILYKCQAADLQANVVDQRDRYTAGNFMAGVRPPDAVGVFVDELVTQGHYHRFSRW